jgi:hypothetical protein
MLACGNHPAAHLASIMVMSTPRITTPLTRRALPCRRSLTPFARHERPVLWRGYCSSPSCEFSCPHDMSNKCANGHNRRFGGVILALHHLCAVTKCHSRADTVLDRMSGGCTTAQDTQRSVRWCLRHGPCNRITNVRRVGANLSSTRTTG